MATLQDILSGNFPAAQRYAEGYAQMPSYLQDPYLGLSTSQVGKVTKGLLSIQTPEEFKKLAEKGKINIAKDTKQEICGLLSGKSKFAELPNLNWDDPKTYDLVDPLIEKGFKAKTIQQGPDTVTLLYKNPKDIKLLETARNPYEYGKAYGYSDADIAHFYNKQFGDNGFNMLLQAMGQPKSLLGNEKVLYHVTDPKNVSKILKEGIKPNAGKGFTKGQLGQTLSEKGTVYAFDNYNDALRWQTKMNWDAEDPKKASQIIPFVDDISKYTPDTHPEYSNFIGVVKKQGSVKPEQIANIEYTKPIRKMAYGEITGQYPVEELQQFKNAIPYLPEARLLSGERTFNPYATKYNTELNPIQNFWNTQGLSQRPLNPEDYGIVIKGLLK